MNHCTVFMLIISDDINSIGLSLQHSPSLLFLT